MWRGEAGDLDARQDTHVASRRALMMAHHPLASPPPAAAKDRRPLIMLAFLEARTEWLLGGLPFLTPQDQPTTSPPSYLQRQPHHCLSTPSPSPSCPLLTFHRDHLACLLLLLHRRHWQALSEHPLLIMGLPPAL